MRSTSVLFTSVLVALGSAGCSSGGGGTGTGTGSNGGSTSGSSGGSDGGYTIIALDANAPQETMFNMAISPTDQIGVVYFRDGGGQYGGKQNESVTYIEVQNGSITIQPEIIDTVQLNMGCTVAFQPSGEAAVGYVGGSTFDAGPMGSLYWYQSQAAIAYRQGANSWTPDICMASSTGGSCVEGAANCMTTPGTAGPFDWKIFDGVSSTEDTSAEALVDNPYGEIVGLWPSLLFDGGTAVMAFRDIHEGQFPIQDWGASDAKMCIGGPGGTNWMWSAPLTISDSAGHQTNGFGVHNQILYANGLIAEIADSDPKDQGFETSGSGPISFTIQNQMDAGGTLVASNTQSNLDWSPPIDPFSADPIENPGTGPSMVYSPTFGFGVVAVDIFQSTPPLYYSSSPDGKTWSTPEPVAQNGSSGFYPALQIAPDGNPIVSYLICSLEPGVTPEGSGCSRTDAELDVAERTAEGWSASKIMNGSFYHPRFGYLSTGKKVFVYSDLFNGGLYVAIEN